MNNQQGRAMRELANSIFPFCRSITGEGVRKTLKAIADYIGQDHIQMSFHEVPSEPQVFDWTVPKEWKVKEAFIEDEAGHHIIDLKSNNLHVMGYSVPVDEWVRLDELKKHISTQPDQPEVIPYVTSYYEERFGFCMSQHQLDTLPDGRYHMQIDSELFDSSLTYGEVLLPRRSQQEIFFSTYVCHPSIANNECSGPVLSAQMSRYIAGLSDQRYTYRFIFIPETTGSIAYLSADGHLQYMKDHMLAGFNLSCVGDDRDYLIVNSPMRTH